MSIRSIEIQQASEKEERRILKDTESDKGVADALVRAILRGHEVVDVIRELSSK